MSWLRLIRSRRVGPATFHRLTTEHGTAAAALDALPDIARAAGVADYSACPEGVALAEMAAARRAGARMVCYGAPDYPPDLMDLPDAPPLLWVIGDPRWLARPMVALVGARSASSNGLRMARRLAERLAAEGIVVVSGLARGIDAAAHEGALAGGTVAVHAGGVDVIYPAENADLAARIAAQGARLSELPMGQDPQARHFPQRNRIVSGLALGVVVVEAAEGSGSLITARTAADQGREIMAVPGHPVDARAAGCNALIRDGATLVRHAEDVVEALGPALAAARQARAATAALRPAAAEPDRTIPAPPHRIGRLTQAALDAIRGRMTAQDAAAPETGAVRPGRVQGAMAAMPPPPAPGPQAKPAAPDAAALEGQRTPASACRGTQVRGVAASEPAGAAPATDGRRPVPQGGHPLHSRILARIGPAPMAEDQLIRDLALPAAAVAPELLNLELDGLIERQPGGLIARVG